MEGEKGRTLSCCRTVRVTPWDAMQASRFTKTKRLLQGAGQHGHACLWALQGTAVNAVHEQPAPVVLGVCNDVCSGVQTCVDPSCQLPRGCIPLHTSREFLITPSAHDKTPHIFLDMHVLISKFSLAEQYDAPSSSHLQLVR